MFSQQKAKEAVSEQRALESQLKKHIHQYEMLMQKHQSLSTEHDSLLQELKKCEQDRITFHNQAYDLHKWIFAILFLQ